MGTNELYDYAMKLATTNGVHPFDVLRELRCVGAINEEQREDARKMFVDRSREHPFTMPAN